MGQGQLMNLTFFLEASYGKLSTGDSQDPTIRDHESTIVTWVNGW